MSAASLAGFVLDYSTPAQNIDRDRRNLSAGKYVTSSIASIADQRRKVAIDELLELRRLGDDWDGEGAMAPRPELVDIAITLIRRSEIDPPTRVVPVNDGRVTLEWDVEGDFLSLRFESTCKARAMIVKPDGTTDFRQVDFGSIALRS